MDQSSNPKSSLLRRIINFKVSVAKIILVAGLATFISAKGPELHAGFIRNYVGNKTVMITSGRSGGSGSYVRAKSGKTFILTNKHVCQISNTGMLLVHDLDGKQELRKIIKMSEKYDLCVVDAGTHKKGLFLAESVEIGETIGIVGHPKLQPLTVSRGELIGYRTISVAGRPDSDGNCSAAGFVIKNEALISILQNVFGFCVSKHYSGQITAYSRGGSSGSPVVDFFGSIAGVLFAGNRADQFESYIVPLSSVKDFLSGF